MLSVFAADKILKRRQVLNAALEKEKASNQQSSVEKEKNEKKIKSYNKRIISFMHDQFLNDVTRVEDQDFEISQELKLEEALRCTLPNNQKRCISQQTSRAKKLHSQIPLKQSQRNSMSRLLPNECTNYHDFKSSQFMMNPRQSMTSLESQMQRVRRSVQQNSILDTSPGLNHDLTFGKLLRQNQKNRQKDVGPSAFRFRNSTAERLLKTEMDPLNMQPPKGIHKLKKTQQRLFEPETVKFYMPERIDGKHEIEVQPKSKWEKSLLQVKNASGIHDHLHKRTHFKSTHSFYLHPNSDKVDLEDREVCTMIKDIQRVVNKRRKDKLGTIMNKLIDQTKHKMNDKAFMGKYQSNENNQSVMNIEVPQHQEWSSDEDPEVNLDDFKTTTKELLQESNVMRRPSIQAKGPHQFDSQTVVFNRIITAKQHKQ